MTDDDIKAILERNRAALDADDLLFVQIADDVEKIEKEGTLLLGPQTELEFQRLLREVKNGGSDSD